jgi:GntR family transcriptional regulator/MocR family aminotransferase
LDHQSRVPLAAQLVRRLREAILDGTLRPENTLPASRRLATELGISRGVVVRAYEQLAGEGYLESRGSGGTRVAVRSDGRGMASGGTEAASGAEPTPTIDLTPGRPSGAPFRDRDWRAAWRKAVAEPVEVELPAALGTPALRTAVAGHLAASRGLMVSADDVVITAGTSDALQLVVAALRGQSGPPGVLMEDPGYPTARRVLSAAGATVQTLPVADDGLEAAQLAALAPRPDAILVTPSHQYPLGGRMPVKERLALLAWAEAHGAIILEDDYDSEFRHRRMPLPALASLPSSADVVLVGTFSKSLSPWLRCGYLVARGTFGQRLKDARLDLGTPVPGVMQSALANYIAGGGLARHIARARRQYAHRRILLLERLGGRADVQLAALDGGLHAVIRLQPDVPAERLAAQALEHGVQVVTLASYFSERTPENGIVIGYGAPTDLQLAHALDVIAGILDRIADGTS